MNSVLKPSVLIMAGGTGGHVFPALAVANVLQKQGINVEWLGTRGGIESNLVPGSEIPIHYINASGLRGKNIVSSIAAIVNLCSSVIQSIFIISKLKPACVLGMGGFVSAPGGLAAWFMRKPLVIHEQNTVAGSSNRLLAHFAKRVLAGYPIDIGNTKSQYVGNPVRHEIASIKRPETHGDERETLKLLVLGGSLGAKPINEVLPEALNIIPEYERPQVWHQTGSLHIESVEKGYKRLGIDCRCEAFIDDIAEAYGWADVILCRSGALTVAEITAVGIASILVPLPYAIDDHQTENARWLVDNDAGLLLQQSKMTAEYLADLLLELNGNRGKLKVMAENAKNLAQQNSAEKVASICMEAASV